MASRVGLVLLVSGVSADKPWEDYKAKHGRVFGSASEENERHAIFEKNAKFVEEENAKGLPYRLEVNHLADWTEEEYQRLLGYRPGLKKGLKSLGNHTPSGAPPPASLDWVAKGAVTPVKNQGQCGSCWAFSTTGGVEGAWQIATGKLVSISEQELVSCDKTDDGCNGGLMDKGFAYLEHQNICTESAYPYTAKTGTCHLPCSAVGIPSGGVTGFKDVHGEDGLLSAIQSQPISVAIEADQSSFQMYQSGVLTGECGTKLDHGVLAVGYGTDGAHKYWKVKNSWGASWGESGYIRIERGSNKCGIASQPSYPVVNGKAPPAPPGPSPSPPGPSPSPPGKHHYEEPPCQSDEKAIQVQGVPGSFCSPACSGGSCPTDVPGGVTARPQCVLQDQSGDQYCALVCNPSGSNQCGDGKCQAIQGTGICTYGGGPSPGPAPGPSPGPAPGPSPGPAPGPSPGCADKFDFCKDSDVFDPALECDILASDCKKTCGCCGASPPAYCDESSQAGVFVTAHIKKDNATGIWNRIKEFACEQIEKAVPEDEFAKKVCSELEAKVKLPDGICEPLAKQIYERAEKLCPKSEIVV